MPRSHALATPSLLMAMVVAAPVSQQNTDSLTYLTPPQAPIHHPSLLQKTASRAEEGRIPGMNSLVI